MSEPTSNSGEQPPLSTEHMLAQEADAIRGIDSKNRASLEASLSTQLKNYARQIARLWINADERDGLERIENELGRTEDELKPTESDLKRTENEVEQRKKFYRSLNGLNRAALCLSGGGIRSATFCLGVIQALASYDATRGPSSARSAESQGKKPDRVEQLRETLLAATADQAPTTSEFTQVEEVEAGPAQVLDPENSLLSRVHYLSTVSGGGYVGSWLSSWRARNDFATVVRNLTSRPGGPGVESPEISWLRAYSNYLTPRIGIGSADTWAAVAIVLRNLILNWLVIIPVVCFVLLGLKIIAALSVAAARSDDSRLVIGILLLGILCLVVAQAFTTRHRPPRRPPPPLDNPSQEPGNITQKQFFWYDLVWAVVSAIAITIFFASAVGTGWITEIGRRDAILVTAGASIGIYALGWICGNRWTSWRDFFFWSLSGGVYGGLVGLGAGLYTLVHPHSLGAHRPWPLLLPICFGVPWVLMAQMTADNIFGGLVSFEPHSDADREWLGRAAGWILASAIAWAIVAFLVFVAGNYVQDLRVGAQNLIAAAGGISGIIAAFLGSSSKTPATASSGDQLNWTAIAFNIALAIAGPVFCAVLVVGLSIGLDKLLLGDSLVKLLLRPYPPTTLNSLTLLNVVYLIVGALLAFAIASFASHRVNINRFSLHALYRNRLGRAYLGASRQDRHPDKFTGFDPHDNIRMHNLWPPKPGGRVSSTSLFHVVNIALNVVSTKRLAWQERKAESFTVSPTHCGAAYLGFRDSKDYGDSHTTFTSQRGIALATAMAVSGAAVSSNMGYHSSTSVSLLMTLFNVRLGWWLGNPGKAGNKEQAFRREGPRLAAKPLFYEAFGQTTDTSAYVYLSDGGHFENLGLYEMVRRRCRFIIVIDAGCDAKFAFEDLGNAVQKIYIDLGVRIKFKGLDKLRNRPSKEGSNVTSGAGIPYCAIGTINYQESDGVPDDGNGYVLYIKPAFHGNEGAGIVAYANAHSEFPHETTADQWFTESQFEAYRSLGFEIATDSLAKTEVWGILHDFLR